MTRVGIDIGGTFTDLVIADENGVRTEKASSTPGNPAAGAFDVLEKAGVDRGEISVFDHGTTVATNVIIERDPGCDLVFLTNEGFADIPEIMRTDRENQYDRQWEKPAPLISRDDRHGVPGRIDSHGEEVEALDTAAARDVVTQYADNGRPTSYAISTLYSFVDGRHERELSEIIREEHPDAYVSRSEQILPQAMEYERASTVIANAYLKPKIEDYISSLESAFEDGAEAATINIMQSNGGLLPAGEVVDVPAKCTYSGPAAGVIGGAYFASSITDNCITLDMGGTSTDVGIVREGEPLYTTEGEIEWGIPVQFPQIDIEAVGAGGGSIAWIDQGGALQVGPRSAGADPGPVGYGRGGEEPTVTDANLVLGRLHPDAFLGGDMDLDVAAAREAISDLGAEIGLDTEETALGILQIGMNTLTQAIRVMSVERGYDPRQFGLVAFGGAGPMHAPKVSDIANIPRVIVPPNPGVLSAEGLLASDFKYDQVHSHITEIGAVDEADLAALNEKVAQLIEAGRTRVADQSAAAERELTIRADLRYAAQAYEITVDLADDVPIEHEDLTAARARFHEEHEREFGHSHENDAVELVNARVTVRGTRADLLGAVGGEDGVASLEDAITDTRSVVFEGGRFETTVYDRSGLRPGWRFEGPAIVEEDQSTTIVFPEQAAEIDDSGSIIITETTNA